MTVFVPSFPRRRESSASLFGPRAAWIPAFAGMTMFLLRNPAAIMKR